MTTISRPVLSGLCARHVTQPKLPRYLSQHTVQRQDVLLGQVNDIGVFKTHNFYTDKKEQWAYSLRPVNDASSI